MPWPVRTIDRHLRRAGLHAAHELEAVAPGHAEVGEDHVDGGAREQAPGVGHRCRRVHLEAARAQDLDQRVADVRPRPRPPGPAPAASCGLQAAASSGAGRRHAGRRRRPPLAAATDELAPVLRGRSSGRPRGRGRSSPWWRRTARRSAARSASATPGPRSAISATTRALLAPRRGPAPRPRAGWASQALRMRFTATWPSMIGLPADDERLCRRGRGSKRDGARTPSASARTRMVSRERPGSGPPASWGALAGSAWASTWRTTPAARSRPSLDAVARCAARLAGRPARASVAARLR